MCLAFRIQGSRFKGLGFSFKARFYSLVPAQIVGASQVFIFQMTT